MHAKFPEIVCDAHPDWVDLYRLACSLALENVDPGPGRPGWKPHMTCMPGVGIIWQWDSCFMATYARYLNGVIAPMDTLDDLYSLQREDGYISMAYNIADGTPAYGERINPPLYAWAEWLYCRFSGNLSRIRKVLPGLIRYFDWIKANRRRESGLYFFEDTGSSGMDNSPRSGYQPDTDLAGIDVCWIDLICQQLLSAKCITMLAEKGGEPEIAERFRKESETLSMLINRVHYSRRTNFYHDVFNGTGHIMPGKTVAGFWPLLAGAADPVQAERLSEHLSNPQEFASKHPVPSLSMDDPNYVPAGAYWLGGVWAPANYMVVKGLDSYGYRTQARSIAVRHIQMMADVMNNPAYGSIWEAYAPEKAAPATYGKSADTMGVSVRNRFVGWSALGPVSMMIEDVLGLDFNGLEKRVSWHISQPGRHGICDLAFNGGRVSLLCDGLSAPGTVRLHVESTAAFTLAPALEGRSTTVLPELSVVPGKNEFTI